MRTLLLTGCILQRGMQVLVLYVTTATRGVNCALSSGTTLRQGRCMSQLAQQAGAFGGAVARKVQRAAEAELPAHARLVVPVMGPGGGSGRSLVAGLLASALATCGGTVVFDTGTRLTSPWPSWVDEPGTGLVSIPADQPISRRQALTAASLLRGPGGQRWQVLTDHQDWSAPPLDLPANPDAWYQLAAVGGWQVVVVDTDHPVAHDIVEARCGGRRGATAAWCAVPFSVPVLCAPATGPGAQALQVAVMAAGAEGLPIQRMVIVLTLTSEGRLPAPVQAVITMLRDRVGAVTTIPFDSRIRTHGLARVTRLRARTLQAATVVARSVLTSLHAVWGDPLPPAPVPAPLTEGLYPQLYY